MSTTQEELTSTNDLDNLDDIGLELYATQGGGLATRDAAGCYVWHELPEEYNDPAFRAKYPELTDHVGGPIPEQWSVVPVNAAARNAESGLLGLDASLVLLATHFGGEHTRRR